MSPEPPPRPPLPPRPPRAPRPPRPRARRAARPARLGSWGWPEWIILSLTLFPALMFVPGLSANSIFRTLTRVAAYGVALVAWGDRLRKPPMHPGGSKFPAAPWLAFCVVWLGLSIFHPNVNSLVSATAQIGMYVAILSPAFWAPSAVASSRQVGRMLAILFLENALSTLVGVGQVFRPDTFNPPYMPASQGEYFDAMYFVTTSGQRVIRPCGLSDSPGAACSAGLVTTLLGLCFALRPIAIWKRLASLGLAFLGVAIIYYSQVRTSLVMLGICIVALSGLFLLQRNYHRATLLALGAVGLTFGAFLWAVSTGGDTISQRVFSLFAEDPATTYYRNRGGFIKQAFEDIITLHPLGYGMGWWGTINNYFGRDGVVSPIWVEVMVPAWIVDGGWPLLIGYVAAVVAAMYDSLRIALRSKDSDLSFWAAVIVASNLSILATCLSYVTFLSPLGVQFWLQAAALHGASRAGLRPPSRPPRKGLA